MKGYFCDYCHADLSLQSVSPVEIPTFSGWKWACEDCEETQKSRYFTALANLEHDEWLDSALDNQGNWVR